MELVQDNILAVGEKLLEDQGSCLAEPPNFFWSSTYIQHAVGGLVQRGKEDPVFALDVLHQCPGLCTPTIMECCWVQEALDLDIEDIGAEPKRCGCSHLFAKKRGN
eukprot:5932517-Amphidinium_carterae.1